MIISEVDSSYLWTWYISLELLKILPGWAIQIIFLGPRPRTTKLSDNAEIKLANPGKPENETNKKMLSNLFFGYFSGTFSFNIGVKKNYILITKEN